MALTSRYVTVQSLSGYLQPEETILNLPRESTEKIQLIAHQIFPCPEFHYCTQFYNRAQSRSISRFFRGTMESTEQAQPFSKLKPANR